MNFLNRSKLAIVALLAVVLLVGCGAPEEEVVDEPETEKTEASEELVIKHELGETVLEEIPENVIVFDYGMLDIMDNLGVGDSVIGLPKKSVPEYLDKYKSDDIEDIGTLQEPNFEKMFELEPDLIIIADRQAEQYDEFEELAPTLYISVMDGEYMDLFEENLKTIGKVFNKEEEAEEAFVQVSEKVEDLHDLAQDIGGKSLFLMANDGEMAVYGKGSRFGVLFNEFGLTPVDNEIDVSTHGQKIAYEYIVENNPDMIFVMDRGQIVGGDTSAQDVLENQLMHGTLAYENDKIIYLNSPVWYVASGGITSTKTMVDDIMGGLK